ncbi:hypothetical protein ACWEFD_35835 [Streptomyces ardesiacus]
MQMPPLLAEQGPAWLATLIVSSSGQFTAATCTGTTQRSVQQWSAPLHLRACVQQTALRLSQVSLPLTALAAGATLVGVRAVNMKGLSDDHTVVVRLDRDTLIEILNHPLTRAA